MTTESPPGRAFVTALCATLPGAEVSDPWGGGHDVWKVGGKMFAGIGAEGLGVSVKTDSTETAALLIETGRAGKAPYLHSSWVLVPFGAGEDDVRHRIVTSYRLIRGALTKKAQAALAPFD